LPKEISEMVGDDLRVVAANRQVCPTISEITFGNLYNGSKASPSTRRLSAASLRLIPDVARPSLFYVCGLLK